MSRVFRDHDKYERECAERARLARLGKIDTHAIGQVNLVREWEAPEGWVPPAKPEDNG